jgi:predicted PurR-regulated permease PerM
VADSSKSSRTFLLACFGVVLALFFLILSPFITPILLAVVAVTLFHPLYDALKRRLGDRRNLAAFVMCFSLTILIIIPTFLLANTLVSEIQRAMGDYQKWNVQVAGSAKTIAAWNRARRILGLPQTDLRSSIDTAVHEGGMFLVRNSSTILAGFAGIVADFFIMIFTLFFLFRDGHSFLRQIKEVIPLSRSHKNLMVDRLEEMIRATFFGTFITALAQGIATGLILWLLGFHNAFLWASMAAFTSMVPMVGTGLVWVPATLYLLLTESWGRALVLALYGALVISTLDNIVRPFVIHKTSQGMHALLIFFGILGGIAIFGFSGLILGPVIIVFLVTILDMVRLEFETGE